jgi:hypothetical protein
MTQLHAPLDQPSMPNKHRNHSMHIFMRQLRHFVTKARNISFFNAQSLKNFLRFSGRGLFPPIGIASTLVLATGAIGSPLWDAGVKSLPYDVFLAVALIFGCLLWKIPRERYSVILPSVFGWLPALLGAATYGFWYWYASGYDIGGEFFHAAADVLPVLLLATIIDVRRTNDLEGKQLVLPIAVVFIGELIALNSLAFPDDVGPSSFAVVSSSLVTAVVALVLAVMADISPVPGAEREETEEPQQLADTDQRSVSPQPKYEEKAPLQIEVTDQPKEP